MGARQVDCIKRACIGELPHTLILCLKRITFDYGAMAKVKVGTACSFPDTLDVSPFTAAGINAPIMLNGKNVMVGGSKVVKADIEASNGVIHVIDTVMLPE